MNKPTKVAIALLVMLIGTLAYFASNAPKPSPYAINLMHHVEQPPIGPEAVKAQAHMLASTAAEIDKNLVIDGRTISHAQMRKVYNVHE